MAARIPSHPHSSCWLSSSMDRQQTKLAMCFVPRYYDRAMEKLCGAALRYEQAGPLRWPLHMLHVLGTHPHKSMLCVTGPMTRSHAVTSRTPNHPRMQSRSQSRASYVSTYQLIMSAAYLRSTPSPPVAAASNFVSCQSKSGLQAPYFEFTLTARSVAPTGRTPPVYALFPSLRAPSMDS
jgi:hypothetical protein